jgi:hypothetical protein
MELDELKNKWSNTPSPISKNKNIMELIQQKNYGPMAELKKAFKKQIILMSIMPIILITTNFSHVEKTLTSMFFISYVIFCIGVILFSLYNYRIVQKMENMDGMVRTNLLQQINILETRLRMNLIGIRIVLLYFIILVEIVPYFQYFRMVEIWHTVHPVIRIAVYALLFLLQYYASRKFTERKFGRHLTHLKGLVKEME